MKKRIIFLISFYLSYFVACASSVANSDLKVYAFSDPNCEGCVEALQPLIYTYRDKVTVYDVRESDNAKRYFDISRLVGLEASGIPLVGIFKGKRLSAIVSGCCYSEEDWKEIVKADYEGVPVYTDGKITPSKVIKEQNITNSITKLFIGVPLDEETDNVDTSTSTYYLLPLIVTAAAVDAINPCEFYVLIVFLSLVFFRVGKKAVLKAGIAFSIAIFVIYYLMGLGLLRLITYVKEARILILILGFSVGLRAVLNFILGVLGLSIGLRDTIGGLLNRKFKRIPKAFSKRLSVYLRRVSENPLIAFIIGVLSSAFLLPCTSGPYFVALGLIASVETLLDGLLLLTLYNSIIMIPFLVITFSVYTLKLKTSELKKWSSQKQRWLNLIAGLLMISLSIYLLVTVI